MGNVGWRAQISFLLAGAIFLLCHMMMSGNRGNIVAASLSQAGSRSFQDGGFRDATLSGGTSRSETDGRRIRAD
jgi:hypothetical protein